MKRNPFNSSAAPLVVLVWCLLAFQPAAQEPILIDSRKQLFLDDHLIESMTRVQRTVQPARKFEGNPVLWPAETWEPPLATVYGSVIRDGAKFKMWYKSGLGVAYAESNDGVQWTKPALDLVLIDGRKSNLLWRKKSKWSAPDAFPCFYELFGVHRDDRDPDPARRYKMGFLDINPKHSGPGGDPFHPGQRRGLGVAASPDGLRWTLLDSWATEAICDGATHWMFDPAREKIVLYGRTRKALPEVESAWSTNAWFKQWFSGRAVGRVESADFLKWDFTQPATAPVVLTADLQDAPGTEIYSMKVFPYEGIYLGLIQVFHATPDNSTLDVQLAVSRDSIHFTRVASRATFIPVGSVGDWDRFNLSLANSDPILVGDELRIYYGGRMYRHGPYSGPDKGPERSGIGFATVKRDRFVALEASFDGGEIRTKPVKLKSAQLRLNAKADFGEIIVEVIGGGGQVVAKSKPVQHDGLAVPVLWPTESTALLAEPVRLRIRLTNARLFALWCE